MSILNFNLTMRLNHCFTFACDAIDFEAGQEQTECTRVDDQLHDVDDVIGDEVNHNLPGYESHTVLDFNVTSLRKYVGTVLSSNVRKRNIYSVSVVAAPSGSVF